MDEHAEARLAKPRHAGIALAGDSSGKARRFALKPMAGWLNRKVRPNGPANVWRGFM